MENKKIVFDRTKLPCYGGTITYKNGKQLWSAMIYEASQRDIGLGYRKGDVIVRIENGWYAGFDVFGVSDEDCGAIRLPNGTLEPCKPKPDHHDKWDVVKFEPDTEEEQQKIKQWY